MGTKKRRVARKKARNRFRRRERRKAKQTEFRREPKKAFTKKVGHGGKLGRLMTLDQVEIVGRELVIMKKLLDQATPEVYATLMGMITEGLVRDITKKYLPGVTLVHHVSAKTHRPDCQIEEEHVHWEFHYSLMPNSLLQRVADRAGKAVNDAED